MVKKIKCRVFSRVVGFYTATEGWNKGKKQEWIDRVVYDLGKVGDVDLSGLGKPERSTR